MVGSRNSINSVRLCEVARGGGAEASLIDGPEEVDPADLVSHRILGLTAGASAPEHVVQAVAGRLSEAGWEIREVEGVEENVKFKMQKELQSL